MDPNLIRDLPIDHQNAINEEIIDCHERLLDSGALVPTICRKYLRKKVIVSAKLASGRNDCYIITWGHPGDVIVRVEHPSSIRQQRLRLQRERQQ